MWYVVIWSCRSLIPNVIVIFTRSEAVALAPKPKIQGPGSWLEVVLSLGAPLLLGLWEQSLWVTVVINLGSRVNVVGAI